MADRRDYTNQSGVFVPTETEALLRILGLKRFDNASVIVIRAHRYPSVLREADLEKIDAKRKAL